MEPALLREVGTNIAGYFRDFLESDFKRMQAPSRKILLQSESGFRTGMRLKPYPTLSRDVWQLLQRASGEPLSLGITESTYTRNLSEIIRKVIKEQLAAIEDSQLAQVRSALKAHIDSTFAQAASDPEEWIEEARDALCEEISVRLIKPLIARLDGPLQRQAYSIIDSLYAVETDMVSVVGADLAAILPDVLAKHLAVRNDGVVTEALEMFLTLERTQEALERFFQSFVTADAFFELRDLETYTSVTEGVTLYLYLGSVRYRDVSYPLFFVPVELTKRTDAGGYELTLVNQLFANRAAIDFVLQEVATAKNRAWASIINDRIIYLKPEVSIFETVRGLYSHVVNALDLAGQTSFSQDGMDARNVDVAISSSLYLCAFDRGAEALVNDYEELIELARTGGGAMVGLFEKIVQTILEENPKSIRSAIDAQWDGLPMVDRMVFDSPIPLNEEQRKVLMATWHPDGPIIVVEGPPGTGKSHTITAIAADCAFKRKSCLILSDKAEALDVVHNKLSEAMSRVRHDREFPNPLLRLGRKDANFKKLVGNQTVNKVTASAKAMTANAPKIEQERADTSAYLKTAIDTSVKVLGDIDMGSIRALHQLEARVSGVSPDLIDEIHRIADLQATSARLQPLASAVATIAAYLASLPKVKIADVEWLKSQALQDVVVGTFIDGNKETVALMKTFDRLDAEQLKALSLDLLQYRQMRRPIIGYLFQGKAVRELESRINALPTSRALLLHSEANTLEAIVAAANALRQDLDKHAKGDSLAVAYAQAAFSPSQGGAAADLIQLFDVFEHQPGLLAKALQAGPQGFAAVMEFACAWISIKAKFSQSPSYDYVGTKDKLDRINTSRMNAHIDSQLVAFMDDHRADARTMAQLISSRQKFPANKFEAVRSSFPVIIAGIREFGEYMPLIPELFDVVVIDEASQVSIAQALPAILRAKKVVVLGDSRQFANVKSANASISTNDKYRSSLVNFVTSSVTKDAETLQRLAMFDVKKSVLEFCSLASSYTIMLRKHFRSYPELIGFSSATFYDGQLQAIKIRGVPLDDVIRFDQVDVTGHSPTRTTNAAEADFIATKLVELLESEDPPTVGVITPFRQQHTLLTKMLYGHERAAEFEKRLRLKVMTFDSCQGEERNIIFYSMVASEGNDALAYVFPASLSIDATAVEEKLKVQRLNVGFSRAQECVWFVHSMPLAKFKGSIATALNHYARVAKAKHGSAEQTDASSPMEEKVLHWLQSTAFLQLQPDTVDIVPQFPIGEYLKQLDRTYEHPAYRVDFLVTCRTPKGVVQIVIEYDGWEYHFKDKENVHVGNHTRYMTDADVERQLTLESYGYRFIRINRFNLGSDPVAELNVRLSKVVESATGIQQSEHIDRLREQAQGMANNEMRQCTRCSEIKPLDGFFDAALKSGAGGYGRICSACKAADARQSGSKPPSSRWRSRRRW